MLTNYLKLAVRNILKHKFFSGINILGMSIGIAACLMILLYVADELSYDRFHPDAERIFQVGLNARLGGQNIVVGSTPPPLATAFVGEIPGVAHATRIKSYWGPSSLRVGETAFTEDRIFHADSNFFDFFGYKLIAGDPKTVLREPNTMVLTESVARKYFGDEDPLEKLVVVGGGATYKVTGVAADAPSNSHFKFRVLLDAVSDEAMRSHAWINNFLYTYIKLDEHAREEDTEAKIPGLVVKYVGPEVERYMGITVEDMQNSEYAFGYFLTPVVDLHLRSVTRDSLEPAGNIAYVYFFSGIGLFIVLIACINFMNLSTARSAGRAKEVGLRKTLGSLRSQMVRQFLAESIIYSAIAVVVALVICYTLLPQFNLLSGKQLGMEVFTRPAFIGSVIALVLIVGIIAGSYPAFYLTSFSVVEVLKGKVRAGMKSKGVRSALVVFQFFLSTLLLIFTGVVYQQIEYMQTRNIGIDKHNVLVLPSVTPLGENKLAFKNEVLRLSEVVNASFSSSSFPGVGNTTVFKSPGSEQDHIMGIYEADYDHQDVVRFEMVEGRYFSPDFPSDSTAVLLNEAAVKEFGFEKALESEITYSDNGNRIPLKVIGVFRDFNFESFKTKIRPLAIRLSKESYQLMIRYQGNPADVVASVEKLWKENAPGQPFDYGFLDERFDELFRSEQRIGQLFTIFSGLAIFIACLGLFALAAFMAEQRTKEIGIRKVMGASTAELSIMLSKEFTRLVIVAFLPAALLGWYLVNNWLNGFAYRVDIDPMIFIMSGVVATGVAWITVSFQSVKAAASNPVNALRYE
jgi:putative ABC transport system permease protein